MTRRTTRTIHTTIPVTMRLLSSATSHGRELNSQEHIS